MIVYNNELGLLNAYSVLEHIPKLGSKSIYTKDYIPFIILSICQNFEVATQLTLTPSAGQNL